MKSNLDPAFSHLTPPQPNPSTQTNLKPWLRLQGLKAVGSFIHNSQSPIPNSQLIKHLLLIRPDHLGDLLFLTPTLRFLREKLPHTHITLMVGPWGQAIFQNNPYVDGLLLCDFPGFTRRPKESPWYPYRYLLAQAQILRQHNFDTALILRFDHWWGAWLAAQSHIPRRLGYDIPAVKPFLSQVIPYIDKRHEVEQNWQLAQSLLSSEQTHAPGPLEFFYPDEAKIEVLAWLASQNVSADERLFVLHPGAGAKVKLWREAAWIELGQRLLNKYGGPLVLSGGPDEVDLCNRVASQLPSAQTKVAAGQFNLIQLAALLAQAELVIGPDTGPLKLAAAVGSKTLQLYGPVSALKFGPWGQKNQQSFITAGLPCLPCNRLDYGPDELQSHFCVRGLSVEAVWAEIQSLLT